MNIFVIRPKGLNVGNDAIFVGLKALLRRHLSDIPNIIPVPATAKYEVSGRAGLSRQLVHEINQYGDGVIIGGGNLLENGELDLDLGALNRLAPPLLLFSLSHGKIFNRRDELVPRTDSMTPDLVRALGEKAVSFGARDSATLSHLRELNVPRATLSGCPTIFLDRVRQQLPTKGRAPGSGRALISIRTPALMNISLERQAQVHQQVRDIHSILVRRGFSSASLLCHDSRDISFAASFPGIPYLYESDPYDYLALISNAALVISYRVHATLPALSFGTDVVNISYDERAISLIETVGFADWDINLVTSSSVVEEVETRLGDLARLWELKATASPIWEELDEAQNEQVVGFVRAMRAYAMNTEGN